MHDDVICSTIAHFRVAACLSFKASPGAQPFKWKWVAYSYANQTHFPYNSWAPRLTSKLRQTAIRKWPIHHQASFAQNYSHHLDMQCWVFFTVCSYGIQLKLKCTSLILEVWWRSAGQTSSSRIRAIHTSMAWLLGRRQGCQTSLFCVHKVPNDLAKVLLSLKSSVKRECHQNNLWKLTISSQRLTLITRDQCQTQQ